MARVCCLAAIDPEDVAILGAALRGAGEPALSIIAPLDVVDLAKLSPDILIIDIDRLEMDPLEVLRRLRFVLPECLIVVFTGIMQHPWSRACHLAGANCVLSKESVESQLATGLRSAIWGGCFTDPRFAA
jgi:DNA-binding NarL/FixJ family response regulator